MKNNTVIKKAAANAYAKAVAASYKATKATADAKAWDIYAKAAKTKADEAYADYVKAEAAWDIYAEAEYDKAKAKSDAVWERAAEAFDNIMKNINPEKK